MALSACAEQHQCRTFPPPQRGVLDVGQASNEPLASCGTPPRGEDDAERVSICGRCRPSTAPAFCALPLPAEPEFLGSVRPAPARSAPPTCSSNCNTGHRWLPSRRRIMRYASGEDPARGLRGALCCLGSIFGCPAQVVFTRRGAALGSTADIAGASSPTTKSFCSHHAWPTPLDRRDNLALLSRPAELVPAPCAEHVRAGDA